MSTFQDNEEAVILHLQSDIYRQRDIIVAEEKSVKELEGRAESARRDLEYKKEKLKGLCLWLNNTVGPSSGTDYVAEVGLFSDNEE